MAAKLFLFLAFVSSNAANRLLENGALPFNPNSLSSLSAVNRISSIDSLADSVSSSSAASTWWLTSTYYEVGGCGSSVIKTASMSTAFCYKSGPSTSRQFVCTAADSLFVNFFSDANCSTLIENVPALVDVCFTNDADDGGYITDDGAWGSYSTVCTLGDPAPLPGDSITLSTYNAAGCDDAALYNVQTGLQDVCYTNLEGTNYTSFKVEDSFRFDYLGAGCDGFNVSSVIYLPPDSCQVSSSGGGDYTSFHFFESSGGADDDGNGVTEQDLIIGVVVSFVGGLLVMGIGLLCWYRCFKTSVPLGRQEGAINNLA